MSLKNIFYIFVLLSICYSCRTPNFQYNIGKHNVHVVLNIKEIDNWFHKDIIKDSLPGVSLEKTYELLKTKKSDTVLIAVIDTELDIDHVDLKNQIWVNKDEIPNNGVDDDQNGYVDDVHGWSFVGNQKKGVYNFSSFEYSRIVKKYQSQFKGKKVKDIKKKDIDTYNLYVKCLEFLNNKRKEQLKSVALEIRKRDNFLEAKHDIDSIFKGKKCNIKELDSIGTIFKNKSLQTSIRRWKYVLRTNTTLKDLEKNINFEKKLEEVLFNIEIKDRFTNDDSHNINDVSYGSNDIQGSRIVNHATQVASIIAAERKNSIGIDGIAGKVKIMPIVTSVAGDEFDKDLALAIRYAVDNGAKIINMSIGKEFSMYPGWVKEAIIYANDNDVLIITSAGNRGYELDDNNDNYPEDSYNGKEVASNFIKVGNSSYRLDSLLVRSWSNYGAKKVDIFAPGTRIYCLTRDGVIVDSGTSLSSAVTTGVAALIQSYYPNLSASETKKIILDSGTSVDIMVRKPYATGEKPQKKLVPFSSLSKSGKIVNAYNALLMAEQVSKKKKDIMIINKIKIAIVATLLLVSCKSVDALYNTQQAKEINQLGYINPVFELKSDFKNIKKYENFKKYTTKAVDSLFLADAAKYKNPNKISEKDNADATSVKLLFNSYTTKKKISIPNRLKDKLIKSNEKYVLFLSFIPKLTYIQGRIPIIRSSKMKALIIDTNSEDVIFYDVVSSTENGYSAQLIRNINKVFAKLK